MQSKNQHILIIDDDERILKLLKKYLKMQNFYVTTAKSPIIAFELLKIFKFDLIVLDVMMPEITGIEFAKKLNVNFLSSALSKLPIIMLTALSRPENRSGRFRKRRE